MLSVPTEQLWRLEAAQVKGYSQEPCLSEAHALHALLVLKCCAAAASLPSEQEFCEVEEVPWAASLIGVMLLLLSLTALLALLRLGED